MGALTINPARPDQAGRLTEIALAAKRHWGYPDHWIDRWSDALTVGPTYVAGNEVFVATEADAVVGFYAIEGDGSATRLEHMWVVPERIGTGVGRALFEHARRVATEMGAVFLEIESEPNAVGFYQRMGAVAAAESGSMIDGQRRVLTILRLPLRGRPVLPETIAAGEVTLRRWRAGDAEALAAAVATSLDHLAPWMPWAHAGYGPDDARAFIEAARDGWDRGSEFNYGIFLGDGAVAGSSGLHDRVGAGALEIGYWVDVRYTRRGYATAAARALAAAALAVPDITRVVIAHDAANAASAAVPARLGFAEVGRADREPQAPSDIGVVVTWEYPPPGNEPMRGVVTPPAR